MIPPAGIVTSKPDENGSQTNHDGNERSVGYTPRLPVTMDQFAKEEIRERWINEKQMLVFPLWNSAKEDGMAIDIFVKCPFDFADEYTKAKWMEFDGQKVPFVGLDCLLKMKQEAARPKDLADIDALKKARDEISGK